MESLFGLETGYPDEGKRVVGSRSYNQLLATSLAPLFFTFWIGWMSAEGQCRP